MDPNSLQASTKYAFERKLSELADHGRVPAVSTEEAIVTTDAPTMLFGFIHTTPAPLSTDTLQNITDYIVANADYINDDTCVKQVVALVQRLNALGGADPVATEKALDTIGDVLRTQMLAVEDIVAQQERTVARAAYGLITTLVNDEDLLDRHREAIEAALEAGAVKNATEYACRYDRDQESVENWLILRFRDTLGSKVIDWNSEAVTARQARGLEHLAITLLHAIDDEIELEPGDLHTAEDPAAILICRLPKSLRATLSFGEAEDLRRARVMYYARTHRDTDCYPDMVVDSEAWDDLTAALRFIRANMSPPTL